MLSLVIFSFISGGLVTYLGYYTPFIIVGSAIFTIGMGLMTMFTVDQPDWRAYGFSIVAGAGCGLAIQNGFMAIQAVLPQETLPIGNAAVMFSQTLAYYPTFSPIAPVCFWMMLTGSGAVFLAISNSVLSNALVNQIAQRLPNINPDIIINAGATGIRTIVDTAQLPLVLAAYNEAVRDVFIMGIAVATLAFCAACAFEWKSIKGKNLAAGMA
jgi:hypothetical protein